MKNFDWIDFDYKHHVYTNKKNKQKLTSVTTFLKQFAPFNREEVLRNFCLKNNLDESMVSEMWDIKAKYKSAKGSDIHFYINSLEKGVPYEIVSSSQKEIQYYHNFKRDSGLKTVASELIIGDTEWGLAGTLDNISLTKKGNHVIIDWKTNDNLMERKRFKKFEPPFEYMYIDKLNEYKLQLNLYKVMLERNTDIKITKLFIVWLNSQNQNYIIVPVDVDDVFKEFTREYVE